MDEARRAEVKRLRALAREYRMFGRKIDEWQRKTEVTEAEAEAEGWKRQAAYQPVAKVADSAWPRRGRTP